MKFENTHTHTCMYVCVRVNMSLEIEIDGYIGFSFLYIVRYRLLAHICLTTASQLHRHGTSAIKYKVRRKRPTL